MEVRNAAAWTSWPWIGYTEERENVYISDGTLLREVWCIMWFDCYNSYFCSLWLGEKFKVQTSQSDKIHSLVRLVAFVLPMFTKLFSRYRLHCRWVTVFRNVLCLPPWGLMWRGKPICMYMLRVLVHPSMLCWLRLIWLHLIGQQ